MISLHHTADAGKEDFDFNSTWPQLKSSSKACFFQFLLITFSFFHSFLAVLAISFQKEQISYSLLINPSSIFSIRQDTGEISLTKTLDYESDQRRYLLMVRASEEPGSLSTATEVSLIRRLDSWLRVGTHWSTELKIEVH